MDKGEDMVVNGKYADATIFTDTVEETALSQIKALCDNEVSFGSAIRVMPDVHAGAGCVIGMTMTITDKVVPNFVGVDIGCGVDVVSLGKDKIDLPLLDMIIRETIPSGRNARERALYTPEELSIHLLRAEGINIDRAVKSIGTLGGGNHFISVEVSEDGEQYLLIHTGSRNIGKQIAEYYSEVAERQMNDTSMEVSFIVQEMIESGRKNEISSAVKSYNEAKRNIDKDFYYLHGIEFENYLNDMKIAQKYAETNRMNIGRIICNLIGREYILHCSSVHNYIDIDNMILRKGAISARNGQRVVIPLNMRDGSILATGIGVDSWNQSAPHGAGRIMSRKTAKKEIKMSDYAESMEGIYTTCVSESTLDESPFAYKNPDVIIDRIGNTVENINRIYPIYNFKADE